MATIDRTQPPAPGPVRDFDFPSVERRRLDNGLNVVAARHGDLPLVTVQLVVTAGAAGEPADKAGVARLTAAALETGTERRSADEVAWAFERLGIEWSQDADWDALTFHVTVPRDRLEPAMELFAEVVRRPSFPVDQVERLRDEQLATILQRRKQPGPLASDMAARFIFAPDVPYARPLVGTAASVEGLGRQDVADFYAANVRPGSAALIFTGDIDAGEAERLSELAFGDWPAGRAESPAFEVEGAVGEATVFIVDRPGAVQSEIRLGDVGVERSHADYFPLVVMNTVLGGAFTSRLNMSLRERHGFTYGARSGFAFRRRPGPFIVQAAVATDVTARAVEEALKEVRTLREDGATSDEVDSARDYLRGVLPLRLQTTDQLAARLADLVIYDLPADYFEAYRERIAAVTVDDVARVAREYLRPDRFAIVVVGDAEQVAGPLEELGAGAVEVHEAS